MNDDEEEHPLAPQTFGVPRPVTNDYVTDLHLGAWLLLLSALIFVIVMCNIVAEAYIGGYATYVVNSDYATLASAVVFLLGTIAFLYVSYPEEFRAQVTWLSKTDPDTMTFDQKYLWGNSFVLMNWLFLIATLLLLVYPVYAYVDGDITALVFGIYILLFAVVLLLQIFWLVASFPHNMQKNGGNGSSMFLDAVCCCSSCHCEQSCKSITSDPLFWRTHLGSDFLVGAWLFFFLSVLLFAISLYEVYTDYTDYLVWLWFISSLFLLLGAALLVFCSYPINAYSRSVWCAITCQKEELFLHPDDAWEEENVYRGGERESLLSQQAIATRERNKRPKK